MEKPQKQMNNEMPYMKYFIDDLPPELVKKARKELGETEEVKAECLKELRCLIKGEPDLNACMEDAFLLRFLRTKKYRVEKAFKVLKSYYAYKASYSGILTDFLPSDIKKFFDMEVFSAFEYRDSDYAGVGVIRIGRLDFHEVTPDEMLAAILVGAELGINMESIAVAGYSIILDFEGVTFHTLKCFASPTFIYRIVTAIQDVMPCRIKGYHIVNQPVFFNVILTIAKTFMTEKLASRLHVHGNKMKSLHEHIPKDILPEELGGKQGPMSIFLQNVYSKKLLSMEDHFIKLRQFGYQGETLKELQKGNSSAKIS